MISAAPRTTDVTPPPTVPTPPNVPSESWGAQPQAPVNPQSQPKPVAATRDFSSAPVAPSIASASSSNDSSNLTMEDYIEAQKYAKYAVSALSFEDAKTAIENLEKAMAILKH